MNQGIKIIVIFVIFFAQRTIFGEIPDQVAAFKKAIQNPNKVANCANCDFRGTQDLAGVDAHGANLPGVTLQPCIPTETNENTVMLCVPDIVANLAGINLANANLFSSCIDGAVLDNADLSHADLSNSSAQYVSLKGAKVTGIITTNSTFCNAIMPDGAVCTTDSWTGQGVTIACNCAPQDIAKNSSATQVASSTSSAITTTLAESTSLSSKPKPIAVAVKK